MNYIHKQKTQNKTKWKRLILVTRDDTDLSWNCFKNTRTQLWLAGAPELQEEKNAQSTMLSPVFYWGGRGPDVRISRWFFVSRVVIKWVVAVVALVWPGVVRFKTGQDFADVFDLLKLITDLLLHLDKGARKWWNAQSSIKLTPNALIVYSINDKHTCPCHNTANRL